MEPQVIKAYLVGAFHDGTINRYHKTFRFCQKEREWLERLQRMLGKLGFKSWIYKEGKGRNLFALETTAGFLKHSVSPRSFSRPEQKVAYTRGYFDAEGGLPQFMDHWFYIQLSQKNQAELLELRRILEELGIKCGKVHIPSQKVDPNYFRFFIARQSHKDFAKIIGSWHPRKEKILASRMKI